MLLSYRMLPISFISIQLILASTIAVVKIDNINDLLVSELQFELIDIVYAVFTFIRYEKGKLTQG